jgi:hypothetical protein
MNPKQEMIARGGVGKVGKHTQVGGSSNGIQFDREHILNQPESNLTTLDLGEVFLFVLRQSSE